MFTDASSVKVKQKFVRKLSNIKNLNMWAAISDVGAVWVHDEFWPSILILFSLAGRTQPQVGLISHVWLPSWSRYILETTTLVIMLITQGPTSRSQN